MDARLFRAALLAASLLSLGANYRTQNFVVTAQTAQLAQAVGEAAESYRKALAIEWLGRELPPWRDLCAMTVTVGDHLGAGGATTFMFEQGRPFGWTMNIQGSRERLLDSVLPHEITHTIFATHFGRPLPRWADEGACTTVEHDSERGKQHNLLITFLTTGRGIAFNQMFAMQDYPRDVLPLYAQGYSVARFLIAQGGKRKFVDYVGDGLARGEWSRATQEHYGFKDLSELQLTWLEWVRRGSPSFATSETLVAQNESRRNEGVPVSAAAAGPAEPAKPTIPVDRFAAADTSSGGGWYARVRDETLSRRGPEAAAQARQRNAASAQARPDVGQSLTRPQGVSRPQQTVLEWISQPRSVVPATPLPTFSSGAEAAATSFSAAPASKGTVWR